MDRESVFIHHCFWGFNFQVVNICACAKDHSSDPNSNISLVSTIELWVYLRRGTVYIMWWRSPTHTVTVHEQATALPLLQSRLHQVIVSGVTGVLMHPVMVFYYQDWTVIVLKLEMVLQKQDEWFLQVAIEARTFTLQLKQFFIWIIHPSGIGRTINPWSNLRTTEAWGDIHLWNKCAFVTVT